MATTVVPARTAAAAAETLLRTVPSAAGYVGEAVDVPLIEASAGRAAPYWVLHPLAGDPTVEPSLCGDGVELDWGFNVTAAGGFTEDVLALVDRINGTVWHSELAVAGFHSGRIATPPGYRPPLLLDRDISPHRPYVPLQFIVTLWR